MEAYLAVFAALFWFSFIQQIRRGIAPNFLGKPFRRDEHPKLFDFAACVTVVLAVVFSFWFWSALMDLANAG